MPLGIEESPQRGDFMSRHDNLDTRSHDYREWPAILCGHAQCQSENDDTLHCGVHLISPNRDDLAASPDLLIV
jgi:hypothetical protein